MGNLRSGDDRHGVRHETVDVEEELKQCGGMNEGIV